MAFQTVAKGWHSPEQSICMWYVAFTTPLGWANPIQQMDAAGWMLTFHTWKVIRCQTFVIYDSLAQCIWDGLVHISCISTDWAIKLPHYCNMLSKESTTVWKYIFVQCILYFSSTCKCYSKTHRTYLLIITQYAENWLLAAITRINAWNINLISYTNMSSRDLS